MKVTSLNLAGYFNWQSREQAILDHLKAIDADIILFQEVVYLPTESPWSQVALLNKELQYPYEQIAITRLQPSPHYSEYREGLAMLSKFPINRSEILSLKRQPDDEHQRIIQCSTVTTPKGTLDVTNVHFSITEEQALCHLLETLDILKSRHQTSLIMGDFNMTGLEDTHQQWDKEYQSTSHYDYISYPDEHKTIDYALVPKRYGIADVRASNPALNLSDHTSLTVELDHVATLRIRSHEFHELHSL